MSSQGIVVCTIGIGCNDKNAEPNELVGTERRCTEYEIESLFSLVKKRCIVSIQTVEPVICLVQKLRWK